MRSQSTDIARAAIKVALTTNRASEEQLIESLSRKGIQAAAVDIGGSLMESIPKIVERALVAAKRTGVIEDCHLHDGAVAGATKEALMQVSQKALGLNMGGKIGIARQDEHLSVCIFMSIGLLHLNEAAIGLGHRTLPSDANMKPHVSEKRPQ